jgi:hypothetical protein
MDKTKKQYMGKEAKKQHDLEKKIEAAIDRCDWDEVERLEKIEEENEKA